MKRILHLLLVMCAIPVMALDKAQFDLDDSGEKLTKSQRAANASFGSRYLENDISAVSMITGGYFTIGTTGGMSESSFDDRCQITFGHPYAMTSYPVMSIDGVRARLDQHISDIMMLKPQLDSQKLYVKAQTDNNINITFAIQVVDEGRALKLVLDLENKDDLKHVLGGGFVIDPAMGQWGDGHVTVNGKSVENESRYESVTGFVVGERATAPRGMQTRFLFEHGKPDHVIMANWPDVYQNSQLDITKVRPLYDVCLFMRWSEHTIAAGEKLSCSTTIYLLEPDFADLFLRWDMPHALALQNNTLFPRSISTKIRVMNTLSSHGNVKIRAVYPPELSGQEETHPFDVPSKQSLYPLLQVESKAIYEERIVPVRLRCLKSDRLVDELVRTIRIPATPISYEGLDISIDSTSQLNYPEIDVIFEVKKEETGMPILDLKKDNIFLFENDQRFREFNLKKFSQSGGGLADVCFVMDCSGSMGDEISAVRNNIGEFADSLKSRGYDFRIGVVTFSTTVDDVWDFTDDIPLIKDRLAGVDLWGGTEDSPSALYKASELSWRPGSQRTIVWITDEPYPEHNYTQEQIVNRMLSLGIKVYGVGLNSLQTDWFNPIVLPTGGNFYDIDGNFRDILLDVARMKSETHYHLTYNSDAEKDESKTIALHVHYAGLGGQTQTTLTGQFSALSKSLSCFPNPFNPVVTIQVPAFQGTQGSLDIYNVLGQRVKHYPLSPRQSTQIVWNAAGQDSEPVSSGFYVVKLTTQDANGERQQQIRKILYLK